MSGINKLDVQAVRAEFGIAYDVALEMVPEQFDVIELKKAIGICDKNGESIPLTAEEEAHYELKKQAIAFCDRVMPGLITYSAFLEGKFNQEASQLRLPEFK